MKLFNAEILGVYLNSIIPLLAEVWARGPMVTLVEYHDSMMMSPEALSLLAEAIAQSEQQRLVSIAVANAASADVEGRDLMIPRIAQKAFSRAQCLFKAFHARSDAKAWLMHLVAENATSS